MKVIPFVHEGLGNSSYIVDLGNGSAVLIDPDRSVDRYIEGLKAENLQVVGVFETHLHADFISGVHEIAQQMGAPLFIPAGAQSRLPHRPLEGGQRTSLDGCEVTAVASPGHTPEHLSYVFNTASEPPLLFSGGSLIVGGAARTDLIAPAMTTPLTRAQFHTLREAFSALPDETLLYPTHGGGSFCSTGVGGERSSTLGRERLQNPMLAMTNEADFVRWFPTTFPAAPSYFFRLRAVNQQGPRLHKDVTPPPPLDAEEFAVQSSGSLVVDVRSKEEYARGHIPGSFNNTYRDAYAVWLGWLAPADSTLLFVTGDLPVDAVVGQSMLVGYERFAGWLQGGVQAWKAAGRKLATIDLVDARVARRHLLEGAASLDVREPEEYLAGHLEGAIHLPLGELPKEMNRVPRDRPVVVYCGHGERASSAISLLEAAGYRDLVNLDGGVGAWEDAGFSTER